MTIATATSGPKLRGTPGQLPDIPDVPSSAPKAEAAPKEETINAPRSAKPETIVVKDLAKKPHQDAPAPGVDKDPPIEASTVEEGLALANKRNRAVFTPFGYVCPSIIRERR